MKDVQLHWRHCGFISVQSASDHAIQAQASPAPTGATSAQGQPSSVPAKPTSTQADLITAHAVSIRLEMWRQQASRLAQHLPSGEELEDSDAAVMAALAFTVEVLKHPFELLSQPAAAALQVSAQSSSMTSVRKAQTGSKKNSEGGTGKTPANGQQGVTEQAGPEALVGTQTGSPDTEPRANTKTSGGVPLPHCFSAAVVAATHAYHSGLSACTAQSPLTQSNVRRLSQHASSNT